MREARTVLEELNSAEGASTAGDAATGDAARGDAATSDTTPSNDSLCSTGEEVIFSCKTASKRISICGYRGAAQYRFGTTANVEMKLPAQMGPTFDKPEVAEDGFISLGGPGGGGAWATFHNGAHDYTVVTVNSSLGLDDQGRSRGVENTSGVVVTKNGVRISFVKCADEPESALPSDIIADSTKEFDFDLLP